MTGERDPIPRPGLSPRQLQLVDMFLAIGRGDKPTTPGEVHTMDQTTATMRARFAESGAMLDTIEDYFYVVAGLNVGTVWVAGMLEREPNYSAEEATKVLKVSLDRLAPPEARRFDEPQDPHATAWYDQAAAFVRDFLVHTMGQDIGDARIFDQIAAGMSVGTEWMQGLVDKGFPPGQAAYMTCVTCAFVAPEGYTP